MKIKLQTGSRISIPKSILPICGMVEGEYYDIDVYSDKIIIHTKNNNDINTLEQSESVSSDNVNNQSDTSHIVRSNTFELKSNLDQASSLSNTRYSKCGLIVKTKTKYVDNYCEKCQGKLLDLYKDKEYDCPYINKLVEDNLNQTKIDNTDNANIEINNVTTIENNVFDKINTNIDNTINDTSDKANQNIIDSNDTQKFSEIKLESEDISCSEAKKVDTCNNVILNKDVITNIEDKNKIISNLKQNVDILSKNIDNNIVKNTTIINNQYVNTDKERPSMINTKSSRKNNKKNLFVRSPNTTIEAFCDNDYSRCNNCKEYYNTGFLIDNVFYCRECAQKDFENYIKLISKY